MNISMFNPAKFNRYVENLTLKGDSILKVTNFFEHIDAGLKMASSLSYSCMPHLSRLSANVGFKQAILQQFPRRSHVYAEALEYVNDLGTVIGSFLKGPNSYKIFDKVKCPLSSLAV